MLRTLVVLLLLHALLLQVTAEPAASTAAAAKPKKEKRKKAPKEEVVAGSPLPFVMPECWPPCPREEETLEQCARAFENVGSVTNACREGRC